MSVLAGRVNVRQNDVVRQRKGGYKVREQSFGPGYTYGAGTHTRSPGADSGRPPLRPRGSLWDGGVVVNDGDAVKLALIFKPPVCTGKSFSPFLMDSTGTLRISQAAIAASALDTLWSPLTARVIRSTKMPDLTRSKEASPSWSWAIFVAL